jgi:hypothetical protein
MGDRPKEVGKKVFEDGRFPMMVGGVDTVDRKRGDGVTPKPTSSRSMEELGVLVPLQGVANFSPSSPIESTFTNRKLEGVHSESPEVVFVDGQGSIFFEKIQKVDKEPAVCFTLRGGRDFFGPPFAGDPTKMESGNQPGSGVSPEGGAPGRGDRRTKTVVKGPGRFESK